MTFIRNIKYSVRQLCKYPVFTIVAVLSLGLAIGANTAVFSVVNGCLLKRLPVRNAHELREVNWTGSGFRNIQTNGRSSGEGTDVLISDAFSYDTYLQFRDNCQESVEILALARLRSTSVVSDNEAWMANGLMVSGNFFSDLGVSSFLGRTLSEADDKPGAEPVAVLSYALWQKRFNSNSQVLGKTITLNGESYVIAGVLPRDFHGVMSLNNTEFYVPIASYSRLLKGWEQSSKWCTHMLARVLPSAEETQICAGLSVLFNQNIQPEVLLDPDSSTHKIIMKDASRGYGGVQNSFIKPLSILMAIVAIILVAACTNVAGLSLARDASRRHERAVRTALGARRWHLIQQSLVETFVIALLGALVGWVLASWSKATLSRLLLTEDIFVDLRIDSMVWLFSFAVILSITLLSGLLPALQAARTNPMNSLKDRSMLGSPRSRLGRVLVSIQAGLCLLILVGAGLFVRTLLILERIDTGFNANNLLVFQLDAYQAGYRGEALQDYYEQVCQDIQTLPGVQSAACSDIQLLGGWANSQGNVKIPNSSRTVNILWLTVGGDFLSTLSIPLKSGRTFSPTDTESSDKVILVNEALARTAFPTTDPIGQTLQLGFYSNQYRIVGVIGDFKYRNIKSDTEPLAIFLNKQNQQLYRTFYYVRTQTRPFSLVPAIRQTIASIDSRIPIAKIKTQEIQIAESIASERLFAMLGAGLAVMAVILVCIGLYGLMSHHVTSRTNEIGIRMALGASPKDVGWPVLREALLLAVSGIVFGIPVALGVVRLIQSLLFGVSPYDPVTLISAVVLLVVVTMVAAWVPARRAAKVDPLTALRYE